MTKQIRKKVFETNSSSSHSLTLSKGDLVKQPFTKEQLRAGVIDLCVGDYHWEYRRYYSAENKLRYLLTQVTSGTIPSGDAEDITRELCEDNERVQMLCDVVREHTGCEVRIHASSGGIDHQSAIEDKAVGLELFNNAETLRNFLFNAESYIQTGNDNNAAPWEIKTDRGTELSYAQFITEVPEDYVSVKLVALHDFRDEGFGLGTGGVITPTLTPALYAGVLKSAIVTSAHWDCRKSYDPFEHREVRGHSADAAVDRRGKNGFKLAPNFRASYDFVRGDGYDERVTFVARVPAALAEALAALDPKGHRKYQLAEAVKTAKEAAKALAKEPKHTYWKNQLAKNQALVLKLGGKKALAALEASVAKKAPAKKEAAKKTVAKPATKKVAAKKVAK